MADDGKELVGSEAKKGGYTYWKRNIDDADKHLLADNKPELLKVDPDKQEPEPARASVIGSKWNRAGTWEEKEMSVPARAELQQILCEDGFALFEGEDGMKIHVTAATVTGDAQAYNIRGTQRLGFEFKVDIEWKGTFLGEEVSGKLEVEDLDSSDLDGIAFASRRTSSDASKKAFEAMKKGAKPAVKKAAEMLSQRMLGE